MARILLKLCPFGGENWIDFEVEISKVIQSLDELRTTLKKRGDYQDVQKEKQRILMAILKASEGSLQMTYGDVNAIDSFAVFLNTELERLIRALEVYIAKFVGDIKIVQKILI